MPTTIPPLPDSFTGSGFDTHIGLELEHVDESRVVAGLTVRDEHLQPYGIVHGGVYASIAETIASIGAAYSAMRRDPTHGAVGLDNHTTFLRAARGGARLVAEATPVHAGRRTQVWNVAIRDESAGREVARSIVRLLVTAPDQV